MRARNPICLALLALFGLYVGNILHLIQAYQGLYTPIIKLNFPHLRFLGTKGPLYYSLSRGLCPRFWALKRFISHRGFKFATLIHMLFTDSAIVLLRQDFREADRVVALYTLHHGRIHVRMPGVKRAAGKLKALSEPFACAEYRIYQRSSRTLGTVTGGKIEHIFPAVRSHLKRQVLALHCCELMLRLTPLHQPNPAKYNLLKQALTELELADPSPAFAPAFTLRLMAAAGFGLDHPVLQIPQAFWQRMHEDNFNHLLFTEPEDLLCLAKCQEVCRRFLNHYLTFPLQTVKPIGVTEDIPLLSEREALNNLVPHLTPIEAN